MDENAGFTTSTVKLVNRSLIEQCVRSRDFSTATKISELTGISLKTCSTVLKSMVAEGVVRESDLGESTGGRKPRQFVYNPEYKLGLMMYAHIDRGQESVFLAVGNLYGQPLCEDVFEVETVTLEVISNLVDEYCNSYPGISAAVIGIPGVISSEGRIGSCDLKALENVSLGEFLSESFSLPVLVENDVNTAALGWRRMKGTPGGESFVYAYYPDQGFPGAGIVVNGELIRGAGGGAGEIAGLPVVGSDLKPGTLQKSVSAFAVHTGAVIKALWAVLGFEKIIFSGAVFDREQRTEVLKVVRSGSPEIHESRILFDSDFHESYLQGLRQQVLNLLIPGLSAVLAREIAEV